MPDVGMNLPRTMSTHVQPWCYCFLHSHCRRPCEPELTNNDAVIVDLVSCRS